MAQEEVILKLSADVDGAKKDLEQVKDSVEDIGKSSKKTAEATGGIKNGLKGVGVALKAAGIGLALKAFEMLTEVFMKNQKTADFFNTTFEAVSIAINDLVNFIFNNFGGIADSFKDVFENPVENIKAFGDAIKENLIERFNSFLDTMGYVGTAISELFSGNFSAAADAAKMAGKELVDVATGVDGSFDKIVETVETVTEKVVDYSKETFKAAKANVALQKSAEVAEVRIQGLIEKYDRQAEKLRQVRDDENATFEDRIKANDELGKVLEMQNQQMLEQQQIRVKAAQVEFDKLGNQENLIALMQEQNELAAIEAQITGFQSEQIQNQTSLQRELKDVKKELALEGVSEREREMLEVEQQYDELFKLAKKSGTDITALEQQKADAISNIRLAQAQADIDTTNQIFDNARSVLGEESAIAKALAVMQATMNTYTAAAAALAPPPVGAGPLLGPILATSTVALGLANVGKILSTEEPAFAQGGLVNGFGSGTSDSVSARLSNGESVINARSTSMFKPLLSALNEAGGGRAFAGSDGVGGVTTGVVKAFVVADDMTKEQDKLTKIRRKATI
tara:strand:+ start:9204 stop:10907 length:1704 start_codon:yes stop_codon:yes gene_type:complete